MLCRMREEEIRNDPTAFVRSLDECHYVSDAPGAIVLDVEVTFERDVWLNDDTFIENVVLTLNDVYYGVRLIGDATSSTLARTYEDALNFCFPDGAKRA